MLDIDQHFPNMTKEQVNLFTQLCFFFNYLFILVIPEAECWQKISFVEGLTLLSTDLWKLMEMLDRLKAY